jgi:Reverse transcriptase (RNA-dependent DNA polymerase)
VKDYIRNYGIDYEEIFTPVTKMNAIKILLSIVVNQKWILHQMNVKNTFLQGTLEEEVYMSLPSDYTQEDNSNLVCRLNKLIYGLKQSSHGWYDKLIPHLLSYNFKMSNADRLLFFKRNANFIIIMLVYVDDIIIAGNNLNEIKRVKIQLKEKFDIKNLGLLKHFLRIEIINSAKRLFISQRKYT